MDILPNDLNNPQNPPGNAEDRTEKNATNTSEQSTTNSTKSLATNKNDPDDPNMDTDPILNKQSSSQSNDTVVSSKQQQQEEKASHIQPNVVTTENQDYKEKVHVHMEVDESDENKEHPNTYDGETSANNGEDTNPPIPSGQLPTADTESGSLSHEQSQSDKASTTDEHWYSLQFHDKTCQNIKKPDEIQDNMAEPSDDTIDKNILNRIQGSIIGMAIGDALGAHVEFRPHEYLAQHPVTDLGSGGTWGLSKGQFTDDTSMALCLANSLVACHGFNPYDQLVRYKWWYKHGYMSSTGHCFDIGAATRQSVVEFEDRQKQSAKVLKVKLERMDSRPNYEAPKDFDVYCSEDEVAGNGALMRLAPVPLFFFRHPPKAVEYSGVSGQITHGDKKAYDACRYYGALIVAALHGYTKEKLLDKNFYSNHKKWFGEEALHDDIKEIAEGSYQRENGYKDGIRGKGYIVKALEAALWAFWSDKGSFKDGALAAVNLGDDTDTTAAIYGQLAGAHYGYKSLPEHWLKHVYAKTFMEKLSKWIAYEGDRWQDQPEPSPSQS